LGYQCLDIGHIAKDYDYFKRELNYTSVINGKGFFEPD